MTHVLIDTFLHGGPPVMVMAGVTLAQGLLCLVQVAARKRWNLTPLLWTLVGLTVVGGSLVAHVEEIEVFATAAVASYEAKELILASGMLEASRITTAALLLGAVQAVMAGGAHGARSTARLRTE